MPYFKETYRLHQALNVTDADLRANRVGYMTHVQIEKIKRAKHKRIQIYIRTIVVYSVWISAFILLTINQALVFRLFLSLLILPILVLLPIAIHNLKWDIQNQPIFSGEIISQTGIIKTHDNIGNWGSLSSIQINTDGDIFRLSSEIVSMLNMGQVYTVHYLAGTKTIVSIEKADQATTIQAIEEELDYLEAVQDSLKTGYLG